MIWNASAYKPENPWIQEAPADNQVGMKASSLAVDRSRVWNKRRAVGFVIVYRNLHTRFQHQSLDAIKICRPTWFMASGLEPPDFRAPLSPESAARPTSRSCAFELVLCCTAMSLAGLWLVLFRARRMSAASLRYLGVKGARHLLAGVVCLSCPPLYRLRSPFFSL